MPRHPPCTPHSLSHTPPTPPAPHPPPTTRPPPPGTNSHDGLSSTASKTPNQPAPQRHQHECVLLRKEVIQPHLPVRLPCYDFVPIASPTFDHSPPQNGLGHGLRVLPTFVT